ncbi:MAG: hypothetical protein K2M55_02045 [Muribaculaceae bacterium]|nr:hypothetical protein [Muribaculaceae bacterium]
MKKSLLFLAAAAMLAGTCEYASAKPREASAVRKAMAAANRKAASMSVEDAARFYRPQTVVNEGYDSWAGEWMGGFTYKYTYNKAGQVLTQTSDNSVIEYEYDESGRLVKETSYYVYDGTKEVSSAYEYTYDPVVKDLVVRRASYSADYETGELMLSYVDGTEITRNDDGNITMVRDYMEYDGEKSYQDDYLKIEYGADKIASKIIEHDSYEGDGVVITDIVWACTDGQIVTDEFDDYNGDMYFSNNRIASATINSYRYPKPCKFTATYDGDSYHSKMMCGDDIALEFDFKCIQKFPAREEFDLQYSYDCTSFEASYEDEDDSYYIEYTDEYVIENRVDAFGIQLFNKEVATTKYPSPQHKYDDEVSTSASKTEVTYDETYGYPLIAVQYSTPWDSDEFEVNSRTSYFDYVNVDPAGVDKVDAAEAAAAEYYTLQGVRVQGQPAPGLYISRKGSTVSKVLVR